MVAAEPWNLTFAVLTADLLLIAYINRRCLRLRAGGGRVWSWLEPIESVRPTA